MILDNILRTINEYLKDMFNTFGGQSQEYMTAMRQVRENIPKNVLKQTVRQGMDYKGAEPTEPLQFSRGKKSQDILSEFEADLSNLRKEQREQGTAKVQAQRYYEEQRAEGEQPNTAGMKERAAERFVFNNSVNDWYEAIMTSEFSTDDEKETTRMLYKELNLNYEDPDFRDKLERWCTSVLHKMAVREKAAAKQQGEPVQGVGANLEDIK